MATGTPGGLEIARNLLPRVWIGAHDERKVVKGVLTRGIERRDFLAEEVQGELEGGALGKEGGSGRRRTDVLTLAEGMEARVSFGDAEALEPKKSWVKKEVVIVKGEEEGENVCEEADKAIAKEKEKGVVQEELRVESRDTNQSSTADYNDIGS